MDVPTAALQPVDLDEQAPGWPEGTARRDVRAAADSFFTRLPRWREPDSDPLESSPQQAVGEEPPGPARAGAGDVPAEGSQAAKATEAEALLAMAQDALAAEQSPPENVESRLDLGYVVSVLVAHAS